MSGTCKDCFHWHPEQHYKEGTGECLLADYRYLIGLGRKEARMQSAGGGLFTTHDFGCNEFEPKEG